jgi:hypothetical protein
MAEDPNIELALLALQRAVSWMRFIQESEMSIVDSREYFPSVLLELDKSNDYLEKFKESLRSLSTD